MPIYFKKFKQRLLDLPMRQKLMVAFMATSGLPLLLVAIISLSYFLDFANRSTANRLHDKLDIANLVIDNAEMSLLNLNKRIAGDHSLALSLELELLNPVTQYLRSAQSSQQLDFAAVLAPDGQVLSLGAAESFDIVQNLRTLLPQVTSQDMEGMITWVGRQDALVSISPIHNADHNLLGYSCIGLVLGPKAGIGGTALLRRLEAQAASPIFLTSAQTLVYASPVLATVNVNGPQQLQGVATPGSRVELAITNNTGSWQSQSIALRDSSGQAAFSLGVALPSSEIIVVRLIAVTAILLVLLIALGFGYLAARWFATFISRPIAAVAEGTRAIIKGNFDFHFAAQGRDEIGLMTEDFAIMTLQLRSLIQELGNEIEQHKQAEAQIRVLNSQLESRVEERTQALSDSLRLLKSTQKELIESEKMAALNHMVVGMAHELNTPIGNSYTTVTFLENRLEIIAQTMAQSKLSKHEFDQFTQTFREAIALARDNLQRAGKLIGFFKQMAVSVDEDTQKSFKPAHLIDEVIHSMAYQGSANGINILNEVDPEIVIMASFGALARVLASLLENAMQHAYPAGRGGTIRFSARPGDGWVELMIQDDGIGIGQAELPHVFEPFYTTLRGQGHIGLGLSIVFNLVSVRLGGTIACASQPEQGTSFTIRLAQSPETSPKI